MHYDPSKNAYNNNYGNNYANQYPPMQQPPYGQGGAYPPANMPPPYGQYPQPAGGYPAPPAGYPGSMPMNPQQHLVATPIHRPWNNLVLTPITSGLKSFFIISGLLYLLWSVLAVGLEIGIIANAYHTYYRGLWAGGLLLGGGIAMLIASCRPSYPLTHLVRVYAATLCVCILALILSIVNITSSYRCTSVILWYYCDSALAINLKITILVLFIITIIHTIVNLVFVSKAQKQATTTTASHPPAYH